jgi:hypothetical protein
MSLFDNVYCIFNIKTTIGIKKKRKAEIFASHINWKNVKFLNVISQGQKV